MIRMVDLQTFEQVGIYLIARFWLAGVLTRIDGLYPHLSHMIKDSLMVDRDVIPVVQPPADASVSEFRMRSIYFVNVHLNVKIFRRGRNMLIV